MSSQQETKTLAAAADPASLFALGGRRALVTGGDAGIGFEIAKALAGAGARVAVNGLRGAEQAARRIATNAVGVDGDIADAAARARLSSFVAEKLGGLDILVLNAAVEFREAWQEISDETMERQIAVNLVANVKLIQAFAPAMIDAGWGRILAISSVQNSKPLPDLLIYAGQKAALDNMIKNLARQFAPFGVTCNSVAPGAIETDRNRDVLSNEAYRAAALSKIPAGCFGAPRDCAGAALLLCSEAGRYITGAIVAVDGGMSF